MDEPPLEQVVDLRTPLHSLPGSGLPTPTFSPSVGLSVEETRSGSANEGVSRPVSVLTGNAPVFVPGAAFAAQYKPKLKLAFSPGENANGGGVVRERVPKRRKNGSRARQELAQLQLQAQTYAPLPSYPPGFAFPPPLVPIRVQQPQAPPEPQEHPLVRWWKHFTPEELDQLQNGLQDLMFTASRLVDEDGRRTSSTESQKTEAWEMKSAQGRLGEWVQALVVWREGLPAADPRSKN